MRLYPDISHWHPVTDWRAVKENCPFLISKATQGTNFIDKTLNSFIKGCEENSIPYWLYTYLNKGKELNQAAFMVNTCESKVGRYFVGYILDVEAGNEAADVEKALDFINGLCYKTMIYTGYADYTKYKSIIDARPDKCAWWEARYGQNTGAYSDKYPCHVGVDLHQFTSNGDCPGIDGRCDLNRILQKGEQWYTNPAIEKTEEKAVEKVDITLNVLRHGDRGIYIKALQILLNGRGYPCGSVDGIFGNKTLDAVRNFQIARNIEIDGIVGRNTWTALLE